MVPLDPTRLTMHELAAAYRRGDTAPTEATEAYFARIAKLDGQVAAYLTLTRERALAAAQSSDARHRAGSPLGPLDGVPIAYRTCSAPRASSPRAARRSSSASCRRTTPPLSLGSVPRER